MADVISLLLALGGCITFVMMALDWQGLSRDARLGLNGTGFGLFLASRYVDTDHNVHAILFALGGAGVMAITIVGLLRDKGSVI